MLGKRGQSVFSLQNLNSHMILSAYISLEMSGKLCEEGKLESVILILEMVLAV